MDVVETAKNLIGDLMFSMEVRGVVAEEADIVTECDCGGTTNRANKFEQLEVSKSG